MRSLGFFIFGVTTLMALHESLKLINVQLAIMVVIILLENCIHLNTHKNDFKKDKLNCTDILVAGSVSLKSSTFHPW